MIKKMIKQFEYDRLGSALIMTIVLTIMLAVIAVMFVAIARMDSAATSNIADNKTLDLAAKSIIELINGQLVSDTPPIGGTYYDYPDSQHPWLASNEPYQDPTVPTKYYWRQISDVTNYLHQHFYLTNNIDTDYPGVRDVILDYPVITLDGSGNLQDNLADADGDGILDSKWIELTDLRTSKGKKIYAAVRVIDNSGMVNVNTAYQFDPTSGSQARIDGSTQMQINLKGLLKSSDDIGSLQAARLGSATLPQSWADYQKKIIWQYGLPADGNYRPFDISDELELRYRYCIDSKFESRLEKVLPQTSDAGINAGSLYDAAGSGRGLEEWQARITETNSIGIRRHYLTTLNLDRIIAPDGNKMTNINDANVNELYNAILNSGVDANTAAQMAVNIIDYRDSDSNVTAFNVGSTTYYGFETPCIYISELAYNKSGSNMSYAIELYKPYSGDLDPVGWKLHSDLTGNYYNINWSGTKQFYVIKWESPGVSFVIDPCASTQDGGAPGSGIFSAGTTISLIRTVKVGAADIDITVDSFIVPVGWSPSGNGIYSLQRDIASAKCIRWSGMAGIRGLWGGMVSGSQTLGLINTAIPPDDGKYIQAHPKNAAFTNIGEIGMIFRKPAYYPYIGSSAPAGTIGYDSTADEESEVFVDLSQTTYQQIFKYLTVIDPYNAVDRLNPNPAYLNETRIKGRININTAPAYVLAQLPWVSLRNDPVGYNNANLANAIVAYRDKQNLSPSGPDYRSSDPCGFRTIGQLMNVRYPPQDYRIDYYSRVLTGDQPGFPDLSGGDGAPDDYEERDLIFTRISDLVTVRSDVFTAYILVRVCTNVKSDGTIEGPQKRYIAILDRSQVGDSRFPGNKVIIRAFQVVPEAR
ncbi:MAG: hypothetical protein ABSE89_08205 [Sedimentisphaerales bacterium]